MIVSLDTETGGLNATENPILQLCVFVPGRELDIRIQGDPAKCHPQALQVNHLNPLEGETPEEAAKLFGEWLQKNRIGKLELIGHNVGTFDVPFVRQLGEFPIDYHYRDTACLLLLLKDMGLVPSGIRSSLQAMAHILKVQYVPHVGMQDCKAAWHCWWRGQEVLRGKSYDSFEWIEC